MKKIILLLLGIFSIYNRTHCSEMEQVIIPRKEIFVGTLLHQLPAELLGELKNRVLGTRIQNILNQIVTYYKAGEQGSEDSAKQALARIKALKDNPEFADYFNDRTFITAVLGAITQKLQDINFRIPLTVTFMAEAIGAPAEWLRTQRPLEQELLNAVENGNLDLIKQLIEKGKIDEISKITIYPNVNAVFDIATGHSGHTIGGYTTPFIESIKQAAYRNDGNFEIPHYLLNHGADINFVGGPWKVKYRGIFRNVGSHTTPLQLAVELDNPEVVNWLVKKRARTDITEEHGWTPKEYVTGASPNYLQNRKALLNALEGKFDEK